MEEAPSSAKRAHSPPIDDEVNFNKTPPAEMESVIDCS